jgi:hypothetical protein
MLRYGKSSYTFRQWLYPASGFALVRWRGGSGRGSASARVRSPAVTLLAISCRQAVCQPSAPCRAGAAGYAGAGVAAKRSCSAWRPLFIVTREPCGIASCKATANALWAHPPARYRKAPCLPLRRQLFGSKLPASCSAPAGAGCLCLPCCSALRLPLTVVCNLRLHADCEGPTFISCTAFYSAQSFHNSSRNHPRFCKHLLQEF